MTPVACQAPLTNPAASKAPLAQTSMTRLGFRAKRPLSYMSTVQSSAYRAEPFSNTKTLRQAAEAVITGNTLIRSSRGETDSGAAGQTDATQPAWDGVALPRNGIAARLSRTSLLGLVAVHAVLCGAAYLLGGTQTQAILIALAASMIGSGLVVTLSMLTEGRALARRISRIISVLDAAHAGDYSKRISVRTQDDVGALACQVNELLTNSANREMRILESALSDPLTGLPNLTLLTERLRHMPAISRRRTPPFAIAVLDLDRFKFVKDTLGPAAGYAL